MTEVRNCEHCGGSFTVPYPSDRRRFCGGSCSVKARPPRVGPANANWRGGKTSHELYEVYLEMVARCTRPTHARWSSYGGRGITVCAGWRDDFWAFVADMGERPAGHSLDRIDNDGGYEPDNVRWADDSTQSRNRRDTAYAGSRRDESGRFLGGAA